MFSIKKALGGGDIKTTPTQGSVESMAIFRKPPTPPRPHSRPRAKGEGESISPLLKSFKMIHDDFLSMTCMKGKIL